jgi:hypothetical protein
MSSPQYNTQGNGTQYNNIKPNAYWYQLNDAPHNDTHNNCTQHYESKCNGNHHNDNYIMTHSITTLSIIIHTTNVINIVTQTVMTISITTAT